MAQEWGVLRSIPRTISVELPDELLAQPGRAAKARRVTKFWLLRESLEKGLPEQPPAGAARPPEPTEKLRRSGRLLNPIS